MTLRAGTIHGRVWRATLATSHPKPRLCAWTVSATLRANKPAGTRETFSSLFVWTCDALCLPPDGRAFQQRLRAVRLMAICDFSRQRGLNIESLAHGRSPTPCKALFGAHSSTACHSKHRGAGQTFWFSPKSTICHLKSPWSARQFQPICATICPTRHEHLR